MSPRPKAPSAETWNACHAPGTPVEVSPVIGRPATFKSHTRGTAWTLGHGDAVVAIEGKAGGYFLGALKVITEAEFQASPLPAP